MPVSKAEEEFVANEVKQLTTAIGDLNRLAKKDPQTWSMGKYRSSKSVRQKTQYVVTWSAFLLIL